MNDVDSDVWPAEMDQRPKDSFIGSPPLLGPESDYIVEEESEPRDEKWVDGRNRTR